jgi:uncharacterized protein (TIGR00730 family)
MMKTITVYCASSSKIAPMYSALARELGHLMAAKNMACVNGAGNRGLMGILSDAILESGGKVTGIIPRFMVEEKWFHPGLTEMIVTDDMHSRKRLMAEKSDGCIALPGGIGTLNELTDILTMQQIGESKKAIYFLNTDGYWNIFGRTVTHMLRQGFIESTDDYNMAVFESPDDLIKAYLGTNKNGK